MNIIDNKLESLIQGKEDKLNRLAQDSPRKALFGDLEPDIEDLEQSTPQPQAGAFLYTPKQSTGLPLANLGNDLPMADMGSSLPMADMMEPQAFEEVPEEAFLQRPGEALQQVPGATPTQGIAQPTKGFQTAPGGSKQGRVTFANSEQEAGVVPALRSALGNTGFDLNITSGHRNPEYNAKVGGAKNSRHIHGDAVDIDVSQYDDNQKAALAESLVSQGVKNIIAYAGSNSIHVDMESRGGKPFTAMYSPTGKGKDASAKHMGQGPEWLKNVESKLASSTGAETTTTEQQKPTTYMEYLRQTGKAQAKDEAATAYIKNRDGAQVPIYGEKYLSTEAEYASNKDKFERDKQALAKVWNLPESKITIQDLIAKGQEQDRTIKEFKGDKAKVAGYLATRENNANYYGKNNYQQRAVDLQAGIPGKLAAKTADRGLIEGGKDLTVRFLAGGVDMAADTVMEVGTLAEKVVNPFVWTGSKGVFQGLNDALNITSSIHKGTKYVRGALLSDQDQFAQELSESRINTKLGNASDRINKLKADGYSQAQAEAANLIWEGKIAIEEIIRDPSRVVASAAESASSFVVAAVATRKILSSLAKKADKIDPNWRNDPSKILKSKQLAVAGSIGIGTLLEASGVASEVRETALNTPIKELQNNPKFQEYIKQGLSPEDARQKIADTAATFAFGVQGVIAGGASVLTGGGAATAGAFIPKSVINSNVNKAVNALKEYGKDVALKETSEEAIQSGSGAIVGNIAQNEYSKTQKPITEGAGVAAVQGAAAGALTAGTLSAPKAVGAIGSIGIEGVKTGVDAYKETQNKPIANRELPEAYRNNPKSEALSQAISDTVAKNNLPPEAEAVLRSLADIESKWGNNVDGPVINKEISGDPAQTGKKARGPWQFMPDTAAQYGLQDPYDPVTSTAAATQMLKNSYDAIKKKFPDLSETDAWKMAGLAHHQGLGNVLNGTVGPNGEKYRADIEKLFPNYLTSKSAQKVAKKGVVNVTEEDVATAGATPKKLKALTKEELDYFDNADPETLKADKKEFGRYVRGAIASFDEEGENEVTVNRIRRIDSIRKSMDEDSVKPIVDVIARGGAPEAEVSPSKTSAEFTTPTQGKAFGSPEGASTFEDMPEMGRSISKEQVSQLLEVSMRGNLNAKHLETINNASDNVVPKELKDLIGSYSALAKPNEDLLKAYATKPEGMSPSDITKFQKLGYYKRGEIQGMLWHQEQLSESLLNSVTSGGHKIGDARNKLLSYESFVKTSGDKLAKWSKPIENVDDNYRKRIYGKMQDEQDILAGNLGSFIKAYNATAEVLNPRRAELFAKAPPEKKEFYKKLDPYVPSVSRKTLRENVGEQRNTGQQRVNIRGRSGEPDPDYAKKAIAAANYDLSRAKPELLQQYVDKYDELRKHKDFRLLDEATRKNIQAQFSTAIAARNQARDAGVKFTQKPSGSPSQAPETPPQSEVVPTPTPSSQGPGSTTTGPRKPVEIDAGFEAWLKDLSARLNYNPEGKSKKEVTKHLDDLRNHLRLKEAGYYKQLTTEFKDTIKQYAEKLKGVIAKPSETVSQKPINEDKAFKEELKAFIEDVNAELDLDIESSTKTQLEGQLDTMAYIREHKDNIQYWDKIPKELQNKVIQHEKNLRKALESVGEDSINFDILAQYWADLDLAQKAINDLEGQRGDPKGVPTGRTQGHYDIIDTAKGVIRKAKAEYNNDQEFNAKLKEVYNALKAKRKERANRSTAYNLSDPKWLQVRKDILEKIKGMNVAELRKFAATQRYRANNEEAAAEALGNRVPSYANAMREEADIAEKLANELEAQSSTAEVAESTPSKSKVILTRKPNVPEAVYKKDQAKSDQANKFIGWGRSGSSTDLYRQDWGNLANTGQYTKDDIVFVSVNGSFNDRVSINNTPKLKAELDKAIKAKVTFIGDTKTYRENKAYNIGERELAAYLEQNGYIEDNESGHWNISKAAPEETPSEAVLTKEEMAKVYLANSSTLKDIRTYLDCL